MKKPNLSFEVRLLKLVENYGNHLFWNGSTVGNVINVTGDKCVVIKPVISRIPIGCSKLQKTADIDII